MSDTSQSDYWAEHGNDYWLLREAAVTLVWKIEILERLREQLKKLNYRIVSIPIASKEQFIHDMEGALARPWNGGIDALNDWLREDDIYGPNQRLVFCFENFHRLVEADREFAIAVLDVIERASRNALLDGWRMIALVQTRDNRFETPVLGGQSAGWNKYEWMNKDRGL